MPIVSRLSTTPAPDAVVSINATLAMLKSRGVNPNFMGFDASQPLPRQRAALKRVCKQANVAPVYF